MLLKSFYPKRIYQKIFVLKKIPLQIFHWKLLLEIFWKSSFKYLIKWQFFLPFSLLWLVETLPFYLPPAWKRTPFGQSPPLSPPLLTPRKNHYRVPLGNRRSTFQRTMTQSRGQGKENCIKGLAPTSFWCCCLFHTLKWMRERSFETEVSMLHGQVH